MVSMATALATANVYAKYAGTEVKIKWPNDIYACDRKAGGILIENIISGPNWKWALLGIGLNINQESFPGLPAISLHQLTGKRFEPLLVAKDICAELGKVLSDPDKSSIPNKYQEMLFRRGERAKFRHGSRVFEGIVKGVTENGQLIITHGIDEYFNVGEIEWLLI